MVNNVFVDTNILLYAYSDVEIEKKETVLSLLEQEEDLQHGQVIENRLTVINPFI